MGVGGTKHASDGHRAANGSTLTVYSYTPRYWIPPPPMSPKTCHASVPDAALAKLLLDPRVWSLTEIKSKNVNSGMIRINPTTRNNGDG